MSAEPLTLAGAGVVLPGPDADTCTDLGTFFDVVDGGRSCLSSYHHPGLALRLAGQVRGWDAAAATGFDEKRLRRTSRPAQLATAAVRSALEDAGLAPGDLDRGRTVLAASSLQFASPEMERYHATISADGPAALGMDYWMTGTPASVIGTVASGLGIPCPTLSVAGSCNVALRTLQLVTHMFACDEIDRAVVVGLDATVDPVFVAGTAHEGRTGYRASSLSTEPADVRPHDAMQTGNATGEGAVAVVLERTESTGRPDRPVVRLTLRTSRSNGPSALATGPPHNVAADMVDVLARAGRPWADIAFVNDYADGNRFVEDHWCDALLGARGAAGYDGDLLLTNQEAVFGHVAGTGGLVKLLASVQMLADGRVAPSAGCRTPYARLAATPVGPCGAPISSDSALVVTSGAGGDATTMLLQLDSGSFR